MHVVIAILLIVIYILLICLFFCFLFLPAAIVGAVFASGWALMNLCVSIVECLRGRLPATAQYGPVGPEPAFRKYCYRKAFLDLWDIIVDSSQRHHDALKRSVLYAKKVLYLGRSTGIDDEAALALTWPLGLVFVVAVGIGAVASIVFALAWAMLWIVVFVLWAVVNLLAAAAAFIIDWVPLWLRSFVNVCPYDYERFSLPVYECDKPACKARHRRLIPGTYGVFHRKCRCRNRLPTMYFLKRHRLESFCPNCGHHLDSEDPTRRPVLLPVVAGRGAGKTSFYVGLLLHLLERENVCRLSFVVENDRLKYEAAIREIRRGRTLAQTMERVPKALQLNFDAKKTFHSTWKHRMRLRLHMYDVAGEAYEGEPDLERLNFLEHCTGIMLLIDPFSIDAVRDRFQEEFAANGEDVGASDSSPEDVYDTLFGYLERHRVRKRTGKIPIPLAVVVTKRDGFTLEEEIGAPAFKRYHERKSETVRPHGSQAEAGEAPVVREWLVRHDQEGLIGDIETQFTRVAYFSCSVFGRPRNQDPGRPFAPVGVEPPFDWILSHLNATRV